MKLMSQLTKSAILAKNLPNTKTKSAKERVLPKSWAVVMAACLQQVAYAETLPIELQEQRDDQRILAQKTQDFYPQNPSPQAVSQPSDNEKTVSLSSDELLAHPDLLIRALSAAVLQNNAADVAFLLPFYQKLPESAREPLLQAWAQALALGFQGQLGQAADELGQLSVQYPKIEMLRLQRALLLFYDKQYLEAQQLFDELKTQSLPEPVAVMLDRYLQEISAQQQWSLSTDANFTQDKNINNAPKSQDLGGGWIAPQPQSAHGIAASVSASKQHFFDEGWYGKVQLNTHGKYYWDNKGYNEANARLSVGVGRQNARQALTLSPFVEQSYYADGRSSGHLARFSSSVGLAAAVQFLPTPNWQIALNGEIAKQNYLTRDHLDGYTQSIGLRNVIVTSPQRYWLIGGDIHKVRAQAGDDSFIKTGVNVGVGQSWDNGLSAQLVGNYAEKRYRAPHFFGKIQRNDEYGASLSVWHQKLQWAGFMPRLTWQYQKVNSNIALYDYEKNHLFMQISRAF